MKKITFINCNILDGTKNMEIISNANVEVTDNKITNIGNFEPDKESKIIDLKGKYLLPGLINLHSHLPSSGKPSKKKLGDKTKLVNFVKTNPIGKLIGCSLNKKYASVSLNSGVTTVRTVGGVGTLDTDLRDKINKGKIVGPRLIVSNSAIGVKGGHMDGTVAIAVSSKEEVIKQVNKLHDEKVNLIKLMITGGVLDGKVPGHPAPLKMSEELVLTAVNEAHKFGLKVAAHVESQEGMALAIKCGIDSIEHGSYFSKKEAQAMKEKNIAVVQTLSPAIPFFGLKPEVHGYGEIGNINSLIVFDGIVDCAKKCLENDIPLGLGTDAGSTLTLHYNFYKELILFTKYIENDPKLALHLATLGNAKIAGIDKITGSIEVNKDADILIVENNPLEDLNTLGNPVMVMTRGNLLKNPKVKHISKIDTLIKPLFE